VSLKSFWKLKTARYQFQFHSIQQTIEDQKEFCCKREMRDKKIKKTVEMFVNNMDLNFKWLSWTFVCGELLPFFNCRLFLLEYILNSDWVSCFFN
jgi:hypothetical protein